MSSDTVVTEDAHNGRAIPPKGETHQRSDVSANASSGIPPWGCPDMWQSIPSLFSALTAAPHIQVFTVLRRGLTRLGCITPSFQCITTGMLELHENPSWCGEPI